MSRPAPLTPGTPVNYKTPRVNGKLSYAQGKIISVAPAIHPFHDWAYAVMDAETMHVYTCYENNVQAVNA